MLTPSYVESPARQAPTHAPTLTQLEIEHGRLSGLRDDLRRAIREAERFVRVERPSRLICRRISLSVLRMTEQLSEVKHDLRDVEAEMREHNTIHYGWQNCPTDPYAIP